MCIIHEFIAGSAIIQISYVPTSHENLLCNTIYCDKNTIHKISYVAFRIKVNLLCAQNYTNFITI